MINSIVEYLKIIVKRKPLVFVCCMFLGLALYYNSLSSGFIGDDEGQIIQNIYIRSLKYIPLFFKSGTFYTGGTNTKLEGSYYRPLMTLSYALMYSVVGLKPFFFHMIQVILHAFNAFLIFILFCIVFQSNPLAFLLAFLFLLHPINIEAVAYLADLQDILFVMFGLLATLILIRRPSRKTVYLSLFFLFLSLLSKEAGILFILMMFLYLDIFPRLSKRNRVLFSFGTGINIIFYITLRCFIARICLLSSNVPIAHLPFEAKLIQIPAVIFFYIKTFFYPNNLAVFQYWIIKRATFTSFYFPLIIDILFFFTLVSIPFFIYALRNTLHKETIHKWFNGKNPLSKVYVFFLFWFFIGIVFYSHIIPLDATVAERWFYFPIIGLLGIIGVLVQFVENKKIVYLVLTLWIVALSVRTYIRVLDWKDGYTLYSRDIKISSDSSSLQNNLGSILFAQNKIEEAKIYFEKASALAPDNPIFLFNLAQVYEKKHDDKKAEYYYKRSIEKGRYYNAFIAYANFLIRHNRDDEARIFLKTKALKTFPYNTNLQEIYKRATYEDTTKNK